MRRALRSLGTSLFLLVLLVIATPPAMAGSHGGQALWLKTYGVSGNAGATAAALSPDGATTYVTGAMGKIGNDDVVTVAYATSNGAQIWVATYDGPDKANDGASAITVSPDGTRVFVTGYSSTSTNQWQALTVAYDAVTGAQEWSATYSRFNELNIGLDVVASPDSSKVYITGSSNAPGGGPTDMITISYEASSGVTVWGKLYDGPGHGSDSATSNVAVGPDGTRVYVAGSSSGVTTKADYTVVAYDAFTGSGLAQAERRTQSPGRRRHRSGPQLRRDEGVHHRSRRDRRDHGGL
jgi:hypothetical protein